MITYLYRWRLKPEKIEQFIEGWTALTQNLLKAGSLGSRLHVGSDNIYYGYAQWPDEQARAYAFSRSNTMSIAQEKMSDAIAESFPEFILSPLKDFLDLPVTNSSSARVPALNQVTIACDDIMQSISFYQKLDLLLIVKSAHYARFECPNGTTLSLELLENKSQACTTALYFEHPSLDNWIIILKNRGLLFDAELENKSWLWREAWLKDPFGNRVCLFHAGKNRRFPPWRL